MSGALKDYTIGASMTITSENLDYSICYDWTSSVELQGGCGTFSDRSAGELVARHGLEFRSVCVAPIGTPEKAEGEVRIEVTPD